MSKYISELQVSLNKIQEYQFYHQGFTKIPDNLNEGTRGNQIYLWFKKGDSAPVTRIQFSFDDDTKKGLKGAGFKQIEKDLNQGAGGSNVYLWYKNISLVSKNPITELSVSTEHIHAANYMAEGWEPLACDLNREVGEKRIYLWLKRAKQTYIKAIIATDKNTDDSKYFQEGYIRLDEDTNRAAAGGKPVFLWYLPTTDPAEAIRDLKVSVNADEAKNYKKQGYSKVDQDLNEGTRGNEVYLWYKKDEDAGNPIQSMKYILDLEAVALFESAGSVVVKRNLNSGMVFAPRMVIAYYQ